MKYGRTSLVAGLLTVVLAGHASGQDYSANFLDRQSDRVGISVGAFVKVPFGADKTKPRGDRLQYGLQIGLSDTLDRGRIEFVSLRFNSSGYSGLALAGQELSRGNPTALLDDSMRDGMKTGVAVALAVGLVALGVALNDDDDDGHIDRANRSFGEDGVLVCSADERGSLPRDCELASDTSPSRLTGA